MDEESKSAIGDRIKPLPSTEGMDDEQLRQLARELHAAIDKVLRHKTTQRSMDQSPLHPKHRTGPGQKRNPKTPDCTGLIKMSDQNH